MDNGPKASSTNALNAWLTVTGLWTAIFIAWLIVGGYRWEGFPCFDWNVTLPVRATAFAVILFALAWYCRELYRVILDPDRFTTVTILLALTTWTLIRFVIGSALPPFGDEAYHWLWPVYLDWCYYDHPGGLAWMLYAFRCLSKSLVALRAGPILVNTITAMVMWSFGRWLTRETSLANRALAALMILPLGVIGTTILFTDVPLTPLWLAATWVTLLAIKKQQLRWWLLLGLLLGLAMNCKFLAAVLMAMLAVLLLITRDGRSTLKTPGPYLATLITAAFLAPTIYWNANHHWQTFYFHFVARTKVMSFHLSPLDLFGVLCRHVILISPLLLIWCLYAPARWGVRAWKNAQTQRLALVLTGYVPFMVYLALKLVRQPMSMAINWTTPLVTILLMILAWSATESKRATWWIKHAMRIGAITTCLAVTGLIGPLFVGPPAVKPLLRTFFSEKNAESGLRGLFEWVLISSEIDELYTRYNRRRPTFIMVRRYAFAAITSQFTKNVPLVLSYGSDQIYGRAFDDWNRQHANIGDDALFVTNTDLSTRHAAVLRKCFHSFRELKPYQRACHHELTKRFHIYHCRGMITLPHAP